MKGGWIIPIVSSILIALVWFVNDVMIKVMCSIILYAIMFEFGGRNGDKKS